MEVRAPLQSPGDVPLLQLSFDTRRQQYSQTQFRGMSYGALRN
jgi:hypothetical protein